MLEDQPRPEPRVAAEPQRPRQALRRRQRERRRCSMATIRLTRSGCRAAKAMPIMPPQSCSTSVRFSRRPEVFEQRFEVVDADFSE